MADDGTDRLLAVAVVAVVIVGVMMYCVIAMSSDPYAADRTYLTEGTVDGEDCEGTGTAELVSSEDGHTYLIELELEDDDGNVHEYSLEVSYDADDVPVGMTYAGSEEFGGYDADLWTTESDGVSYVLYVIEGCVVIYLEASSDTAEFFAVYAG